MVKIKSFKPFKFNLKLRQFKVKQSISHKFMTTFIIVLVLSSLLFSVSFYYVAMGIISDNVLPQFNNVLVTSSKDIYKNLDTTAAQQLSSGGENSRFKLESYLTKSVKNFGLDTAYVLQYRDDVATVLAQDDKSVMKPGDKLEIQDALKNSLKGKMQISDLYKDDFGTHKTSYTAIPGSSLILAVGMDGTFIEKKQDLIFSICLWITILIIAVGMIIAYFTSNRITKSIKKLVTITEQMATGDFSNTINVKGKDEIAQLSNSFMIMRDQLKGIIEQVNHTSQTVTNGANDLFESSNKFTEILEHSNELTQRVQQGSTTIASASVENARAMEEISQGIQSIAVACTDVTEQIATASSEATTGNELSQTAISQMEHVKQSAHISLNFISVLGERADSIAQVVQTISEITKQINILALNAAIEAVRAGEHGKGFSVVAEEVRVLAAQSRQATNEIGEYLISIQEESLQSVSAMKNVTKEVEDGAQLVVQAGDAFKKLANLIESINLAIHAVSASTQQVSAGSQEVTASVEESATITAQSLEGMQEITSNSDRQLSEMEHHTDTVTMLQKQASALNEAILKFKI